MSKIGVERACEIAKKASIHDYLTARIDDAVELASGWYFPWHMTVDIEMVNGVPMNVPIGSNGIIINKSNGATFTLGSAWPSERYFKFYDLGYRTELYDVVITAVHDLNATASALVEVGPTVVDLSFESGTVWRIPRKLRHAEIAERLEQLPYILPDTSLYFGLERFHSALDAGAFDAEVIGRPNKP